MESHNIRRARRTRAGRAHILIPSNARYTTLPSADVLLDPNMVEEILAAHNKLKHSTEEDKHAHGVHATHK